MYIHNNINNNTNRHILMNIQTKKRILEFLREKRVITSSELAEFLNINWNTSEKYLLELGMKNKIIKIKKKGVNLWLLK